MQLVYIGQGEYCVEFSDAGDVARVVPIVSAVGSGSHTVAVWDAADSNSEECPGATVLTRSYEANATVGNRSDEPFSIVVP